MLKVCMWQHLWEVGAKRLDNERQDESRYAEISSARQKKDINNGHSRAVLFTDPGYEIEVGSMRLKTVEGRSPDMIRSVTVQEMMVFISGVMVQNKVHGCATKFIVMYTRMQ